MDLAVANSITAVEAGIYQVQGTINGFGETFERKWIPSGDQNT